MKGVKENTSIIHAEANIRPGRLFVSCENKKSIVTLIQRGENCPLINAGLPYKMLSLLIIESITEFNEPVVVKSIRGVIRCFGMPP